MNFSEYQRQALNTDQIPAVENTELIIPLLGLVGEVGSLMTEYKKHLRDGQAHKLFEEGIAKELGDMLWYISNLASKFNLDLEEIAEDNLKKCRDRWGWRNSSPIDDKTTIYTFDSEFPEHERLPRKFEVEITEISEGNTVKMRAFVNGKQIGNDLTDNFYSHDGYRFHDVFHFSYAAVLGWSAVTRSNLKRKRKSNSLIDEVEDGGRAAAIEEGISALVFSYAKHHGFLEGISTLDYQLLKTIKNITAHLEVSQCSLGDWEKAILMGYDIWRQVEKYHRGTIVVDLDARSISYQISH
ncbi:nucleoside triphosphate pyrophosphohydrolase family protein [Anabaena azotica]|uniref:Nucleoside triphosphate pyrophosphohydrolase family protein n=1 Tax=Anabaena azotica FACHB-119 TaxID=947527 RepID=A0ABR8D0N4_9NOST|nr:nucleoside triphosphate pyrophosphohydrolase family protein [Anabaena azotica]MBD2499961.1 nucleoside triphosphate pyrophosphohydrolase family protein [Anabaena azotica FACHB-119]